MIVVHQLVVELRVAATPKDKIQADLMLRALREVLTDREAIPQRQLVVVQTLVKEILIGVKDSRVTLVDVSHGSMPVSAVASGERFDQRTEWLPDLDSNQKPSH